MTREVGVGVVGTGYGQRVQMPAIAHVDGARLVAVTSGHLESARKAAASFEIPHIFATVEELAAHPAVDVVFISSPPHTHERASAAAVANRKHVLCEKPMALDLRQATRMRDEAEGAGVINLIDHELRFSPNRKKAHDLLEAGHVGEVFHVNVVYRTRFGLGGRPYSWWHQAELGGGLLGAIGSHVVDTLTWWLGRISSVDCDLKTFVSKRRDAESGDLRLADSDEFVSLRLEFESGVTGEVSLSCVAAPQQHTFEIVGSEKTLVLDEESSSLRSYADGEVEDFAEKDASRDLPGILDNVWAPAFVNLTKELIGAISSGRRSVPHAATYRDGVGIQAVLDAARVSSSRSRSVPVEQV